MLNDLAEAIRRWTEKNKSDMERLVKMCGKYGGALSDRPVCILGEAFSRQEHIRTPQGGVMADHMITMVADSAHGADQRWAFRSHLSKIKYVAVILHESKLKWLIHGVYISRNHVLESLFGV